MSSFPRGGFFDFYQDYGVANYVWDTTLNCCVVESVCCVVVESEVWRRERLLLLWLKNLGIDVAETATLSISPGRRLFDERPCREKSSNQGGS